MKLIDVVRDIENIEDDLIIFQENLDLFDSDVYPSKCRGR